MVLDLIVGGNFTELGMSGLKGSLDMLLPILSVHSKGNG